MALTVHQNLEEAMARHAAMIEELKRKLRALHLPELYTFLFIAKTEQDILTARTLADHGIAEKRVPVDVAVLCKQAVLAEQDFAQAFHVPLQFALPHFGQQDIAPLITPLFTIASEKFTGPFFTAPCEMKYLSIAIQKLLELAILLGAKEKLPLVKLAVQRQGGYALCIAITATVPPTVFEKQTDLFMMYYGALAGRTSLPFGSGLEGYLAKTILETLNIPMTITTEETQHRMTFELQLRKEKK